MAIVECKEDGVFQPDPGEGMADVKGGRGRTGGRGEPRMGAKGREFENVIGKRVRVVAEALGRGGRRERPPKESGGDGFEVEFFEVGGADGGAGEFVHEAAGAHHAGASGVFLGAEEIVRGHENGDAARGEFF